MNTAPLYYAATEPEGLTTVGYVIVIATVVCMLAFIWGFYWYEDRRSERATDVDYDDSFNV